MLMIYIVTALEDGIPVTDPAFWVKATDKDWESIFRPSPDSKEPIPLLDSRIRLLRETGRILMTVSTLNVKLQVYFAILLF